MNSAQYCLWDEAFHRSDKEKIECASGYNDFRIFIFRGVYPELSMILTFQSTWSSKNTFII